jgi:hypothetical protein
LKIWDVPTDVLYIVNLPCIYKLFFSLSFHRSG